jgi:GDP-L-fucose synthase
MKRVLVTGGCGFVGRALVKKLVALDIDVTIVDDLSTGIRPNKWLNARPGQVIFHHSDLRDYLRSNKNSYWDTIFHLAAIVGGRLKIEYQPLQVATDLAIDADLFRWLVNDANLSTKLVYFSSSAVYPLELQTRAMHPVLNEAFCTPTSIRVGRPDMTYGWAKLTGEQLAYHAVTQHGAHVVIYRPFGGYGEGQSMDYPFPSIVQRVLNHEDPVVVWGSGKQKRDFIHIDDCIEAILASMDRLVPGQALNLGTGIGTSFEKLALMAGVVLGTPLRVRNDDTKPEGVYARVADISLMKQFYTPKIMLYDGIERVANSLTRQPT